MTKKIEVACSPEQADIILDHLIANEKLYMRQDERAWMQAQLDKIERGLRIMSATLDIQNSCWILEIETK